MKRETGVTLVELLVAITITLVVMATTLGAFTDALRANESVVQLADMTDNLRAGMNLMVGDFIQTGAGIPTGGIPIPAGGLPINRPSPPGMAYTFGVGATSLASISPGPSMGPAVSFPDATTSPPTDIVTILYADNTIPLNTLPLVSITATGSQMVVDPSIDIVNGDSAIRPGDLIMFSNAQGNALQMVTSVTAPNRVNFATGDPFGLNQRTDPAGTIRQIQAPMGSGTYPPTTATRVWMASYYLDTTTDPAYTRLVRQVNFNTPQPVGEIFEHLQVTYNFVDGVTNPSNQRTVPAGLSAHQIRAVNLFLAARSHSAHSKTGKHFRNNLATQVSLRSLAYVNRYR